MNAKSCCRRQSLAAIYGEEMARRLCRCFHRRVFVVRLGRSERDLIQGKKARWGDFYLFRPSEATAVAQISPPARAASPLRRDTCVAIGTVLLHMTLAFSPLPLFPPAEQTLEFFNQYTILFLHLSKLKLPTCRPRRLQLIKNIIFRGQRFVLGANTERLTRVSQVAVYRGWLGL